MGQFGEALRQEREARGITLETISNVTKVGSRHLIALEEEKFEQLPGGVLNKGIVKGYARAVGLDEVVWVENFLIAYRSSGLAPSDDPNWTEFAENVSRNRHHLEPHTERGLRWAGVAVLLLALVGLGWFVWRYVSEREASGSYARPSATALSWAQPGAIGDAHSRSAA